MQRSLVERLISKLLQAAIRFYQFVVSPLLGAGCRFHPTCSEYARGAIREHGVRSGCRLALQRVLRCNPWCAAGDDPVPAPDEKLGRI